MPHSLDWWLHSDGGLLARIAIGCSIFAALAFWDLAVNRRRATRWREYLFLLFTVATALIYGLLNDWIASRISWEYFYYGKGLDQVLGTKVPPDPFELSVEACKIGLKATWTSGLIVGVALLLANNPRKNRRQLRYRTLGGLVLIVFVACVAFAALGALAGRAGWLNWTSRDLRALVAERLFRPRQFLCVWGINLGGYVGGSLSTIIAVWWILRHRRLHEDLVPNCSAPHDRAAQQQRLGDDAGLKKT